MSWPYTDKVTTEEAFTFFDSLKAATMEEMIGEWRGSVARTGHPFEGLLESIGWYGKAILSPEVVYPVIVQDKRGELFCVNTNLLPASLAPKLSLIPRLKILSKVAQAFHTSKPTARVRMTDYRGVVTATMIYDSLPIQDVFKKVDEETRIGVMDMRDSAPLFFLLKKSKETSDLYKKLNRRRT